MASRRLFVTVILMLLYAIEARFPPYMTQHSEARVDDRHWRPQMMKNQENPEYDGRSYLFDRDRFDRALNSISEADDYMKELLFEFAPEIDGTMETLFAEVFRDPNQPIRRGVDDKCDEVNRTIASIREDWKDFKMAARDDSQTCEICKFLMNILKTIVCNVEHDVAVNAFVRLCEFVLERYNSRQGMCEGVITLQAPYVFAAWKESTPYDFCEHLNRCVPAPSPTRSSVERRIWQILASPRRHPSKPKTAKSKKDRNNIRIVQLSDVHISPRYAVGSAIECNMYICCLEEYDGEGSARMYGEHLCNIPERTMLHFMDELNEMDPDIILFTGDAPPHIIWDETFESQLNCTRILVSALRDRFPDKAIFPTFGNHEQFPTNVYATRVNYTMMMNRAFTLLWDELSGFGPEQRETMDQMGYYSIAPASYPGLRILSMNTNHYWYTLNFMCTLNQNTTDEQVYRQFIVDTLQAARDNLEKVIIISHHPVGGSDHLVRVSRWWEGVAYEYSDVIIMHLSGHTHKDEFHLIMDPETMEAKYVNFVATSVTANHRVNPSMKLFHLDGGTFDIMDIESFYMELDDQKPDKPPPIVQTYDAKQVYGLDDLTPESWKELSLRFLDDDDLFQKWYQNRDAKAMMNTCTGGCKIREICRLWFPNYDEVEACIEFMSNPPPPQTTPETGGASGLPVPLLVVFSSLLFYLLT